MSTPIAPVPHTLVDPSTTLGRQAQALLEPKAPRAAPRHAAPWIAVTGGKGGVGKTVLAVNLALQLARTGHRTLLVDLDPGLGNVDVHLRLGAQWNLEDLADGHCEPRAAVVRGPGNIDVVVGRSGSTRLTGGDPTAIQQVLDAIETLSHDYDAVVCDSGAGIGPLVLETARRAKLVLAVTTPEPASLTDTYALCKVLHGMDQPLPTLVFNQVEGQEQALNQAGKLRGVARRFLRDEPAYLGSLRKDQLVARSAIDQKPFSLGGTGGALQDLRALGAAAAALLPPPRHTGRERTNLLPRPPASPTRGKPLPRR